MLTAELSMRRGASERCVRVAVAVACLLLGLAAGARAESLHSLQSTEEAFYKAGLPVEFD
jgi:hypothetical protein